VQTDNITLHFSPTSGREINSLLKNFQRSKTRISIKHTTVNISSRDSGQLIINNVGDPIMRCYFNNGSIPNMMLSQKNPIHCVKPYFFKIYFNIIRTKHVMWILVSTLAPYSVDSDRRLSAKRPSIMTKVFRCIPQVTGTGSYIRTWKFTYNLQLINQFSFWHYNPTSRLVRFLQIIPDYSIFTK
jgi:hypothetical protein